MRAKGQGADRLKPGYKAPLELAEDLLTRADQLLEALPLPLPPAFSLTVREIDPICSGADAVEHARRWLAAARCIV